MADNKKGKAEKHVEKLTDKDLDKVSGGTKIGCQPSWTPCEPKLVVGCGPTASPGEQKIGCLPTGTPEHNIGCLPTATPCGPKHKVGCGPTATPK